MLLSSPNFSIIMSLPEHEVVSAACASDTSRGGVPGADLMRGPTAEIMPFLSSPAGQEFAFENGLAMPAAYRMGDDHMLKGTLRIDNVLPREGTLDFLRAPSELGDPLLPELIAAGSHERRHGGGGHGRRHGHHGDRSGPRRRERHNDDEPASSEKSSGDKGTFAGRAQKVFNFLTKEMHLTKAQAAGVLGNFIQEDSDLNPAKGGDNGHALGIAQWNGPRKRALFAFARETGGHATDLDTQLKFLKHELEHGENRALRGLRQAHTPEQAALVFSRLFERAGTPMNGNRVRNAKQMYSQFA